MYCNETMANKPVNKLPVDSRKNPIPEGVYLCHITGLSNLQQGITHHKDNKYITTSWSRYCFALNPIDKYPGYFDDAYCFNNSLPIYIDHKGGNHTAGGVGDMGRMRLEAMTGSYHNYTSALKIFSEQNGLEFNQIDIGGFAYDPSFDALSIFESNGYPYDIVGRLAIFVKFEEKQPYGVVPVRAWEPTVEEWVTFFESGVCPIPFGTIEITGPGYDWLSKYHPVRSDAINGSTAIVDIRTQGLHSRLSARLSDGTLNNKWLYVDRMQRPGKHEELHHWLKFHNYKLMEGNRLAVGDYLLPNKKVYIDTKRSIYELAQNLTGTDRVRFEKELAQAEYDETEIHIVVNLQDTPELQTYDLKSFVNAVRTTYRHPMCQTCSCECEGTCSKKPGSPAPITGESIISALVEIYNTYRYTEFHFVHDAKAAADCIRHIFESAPNGMPPHTIIS